LREEGLAGSGRANQENIGFAEFDVARLFVQEDSLVVVVDRHGKFFLGAILADDVAVEELLDFGRAREAASGCRGLLALFILKNGLADADTFVADISTGIV